MIVTGAAGAGIVVRRARRRAGESDTGDVDRRLLQVGLTGTLGLLPAAAGRLYAYTYSVFGMEEPVTAEYLRLVAFDTSFGAAWRWQVAAAAVGAVVVALGWKSAALRRYGPGVAAAMIVVTLPLAGHAQSQVSPWLGVPLQSVHIGGAGAWVGTLVVALLLTRHASDAVFAGAIQTFSPVAVVAVGTLALSGIVSAWVYLDAVNALWHTAYGRMLVVKIGLFTGVGGLGMYNWRRLRPALVARHDTHSRVRLRRIAILEVSLAALVLLATAILVALPIGEH